MRPRQWIPKNIFIFAALIFDRQLSLHNFEPFLRTFAGFCLFCAISSSVYIINDIVDVEADRKHPQKCKRPIAAGILPVRIALIAVVIMLLVIFPLSYLLSPSFTVVALLYLLVNLAYSNWLKHIPLVDVLILAMGFVLRVGAGVTLITVERFSPWLYICMTMLALFMGFGKRRAELSLLAGDANSHRKVLEGYTIPFLDQLIMIVSSTTVISYILYTISAPSMPANHSMMLTIPFVVYAIFRYLYLVQVRGKGGAPEDLVLTDRPFQISLVLWALSVFVIFYLLS